jgi:hypothetical protein
MALPGAFHGYVGKAGVYRVELIFAQFGFNNMKIFNVLVAVTTGILGFGILKRSGSPLSGLYFYFCFLRPYTLSSFLQPLQSRSSDYA